MATLLRGPRPGSEALPVAGETVFPYLEAAGPGRGYRWNNATDYREMTCRTVDEARCGAESAGSFDHRAVGMQYCCCAELLRVRRRGSGQG